MPCTSFLAGKTPEGTGEPPEGPSGSARGEQPGIDTAGHGGQHSYSAPWLCRQNTSTHSSIPDCLRKQKPVASFTVQLLSQRQMTKKTKGKYEQGSNTPCFCAPLVARKNISLVSLWALQVSIGGALLVAREHKTANIRKKIGIRSKALRMFVNVCPLIRSARRLRDAPPIFSGTNLGSVFPRYFV